MIIIENNYGVRVSGFGKLNLPLTLDGGQCFRWRSLADGAYSGGFGSYGARILEDGSDLLFLGARETDIRARFIDYLDLNTDYEEILQAFREDKTLSAAIDRFGCLRILRQEPWETLCSFIISACNNITRIKGIIDRLCTCFGEKNGDFYAFPAPERLAALSEGELSPIRAGYRVRGILDAARKVSSGEINLAEISALSTDELRTKLMSIYGVGQKVADCTMLFGFSRKEVYPVDRHIKRLTEELYPRGLPECVKGFEGVAQQYLFSLAIK